MPHRRKIFAWPQWGRDPVPLGKGILSSWSIITACVDERHCFFINRAQKSPLGMGHRRAFCLHVPTRQLQRLCEQPEHAGSSLPGQSMAAGWGDCQPHRSSQDTNPGFWSIINDGYRAAVSIPRGSSSCMHSWLQCSPTEHSYRATQPRWLPISYTQSSVFCSVPSPSPHFFPLRSLQKG